MAWTTISNALVAVGALPFATTIQALRDNPIAIAAGDVGAPRVVPAGLDRADVRQGAGVGMATNEVRIGFDGGAAILAQVDTTPFGTLHTSGLSTGAVGTYAMLRLNDDAVTLNPGDTRAGSSLRYSNAAGATGGAAPSGTWRLNGGPVVGASAGGSGSVAIWLRIS